jgi:hypothetical protein
MLPVDTGAYFYANFWFCISYKIYEIYLNLYKSLALHNTSVVIYDCMILLNCKSNKDEMCVHKCVWAFYANIDPEDSERTYIVFSFYWLSIA